jgi:hypothetical protein
MSIPTNTISIIFSKSDPALLRLFQLAICSVYTCVPPEIFQTPHNWKPGEEL